MEFVSQCIAQPKNFINGYHVGRLVIAANKFDFWGEPSTRELPFLCLSQTASLNLHYTIPLMRSLYLEPKFNDVNLNQTSMCHKISK